MMRNTTNILMLLLLISLVCRGQQYENRIVYNTIKTSELIDDKEIAIFKAYFETIKYSIPTAIDFNARNKAYLGINSEGLIPHEYSGIVIHGEYIDYQISQHDRFVKIGQDNLPDLDQLKVTIRENKKQPYFEDVADLNKVLYGDDENVIDYVARWKKDLASDLVILFNYEKDDRLTETAIENIISIADQPSYFNWSMLFYNDRRRKVLIRKELIAKIFNNNPVLVSDLIKFVVNNNIYANQKERDEALAYLINLELKENENKDWDQNEGFGMLSYCYNIDKYLMDRFRNIYFYNYSLLKDASNAYNDAYQRKQSVLYQIKDPDGYTNVRKYKNALSEVLQKIKSGDQIRVLNQTGDWWLVETEDGKQGYIHKSRMEQKKH